MPSSHLVRSADSQGLASEVGRHRSVLLVSSVLCVVTEPSVPYPDSQSTAAPCAAAVGNFTRRLLDKSLVLSFCP